MKKRLLFVVIIMLLIITSLAALAACGDEDQTVYDAGEYGRIKKGSHNSVVSNDGYRFIGWSEPVQQGKKTVCKAQYEYAEYYMSEVKDVYDVPQRAQDGFPNIIRKVTDMQTMESTEDLAPIGLINLSCSDDRFEWSRGRDWVVVNGSAKEFDGICTITIADKDYRIEKEMQIHIVRNCIKPEKITIYPGWGSPEISIGGDCYIARSTVPAETTFPGCGFNIVEIIRNGEVIAAERHNEIAYLQDERWYKLYTTDNAQAGDIIKIQAYNLRDSDVVSNVLTITVRGRL